MSVPLFQNLLGHYTSLHQDQIVGLSLELQDVLSTIFPQANRSPPAANSCGASTTCCSKTENQEVSSCGRRTKEHFRARLDLRQFKPEEISVTMAANVINVEAKHEEREDEYGSTYRHVVRKVVVPDGHDLEKADSKWSPNGILSITVPPLSPPEVQSRNITVVREDQQADKKGDSKGDEEEKATS